MNKTILILNAIFDLGVLFTIRYYVDGFCEDIWQIKMILMVVQRYIGNVKCSTILVPFQLSGIVSYTTNLLNIHSITLSATLCATIRMVIFIALLLNPMLILMSSKLVAMLDIVGIIGYSYLLTQMCWIPGKYFQYNLQHAQLISIPILIVYIISIYYTSTLCRIFCIIIPILQIIITDKGSLITSLLLGIIVSTSSLLITYISMVLVLWFILKRENKYEYIIIGPLISASQDINQNIIVIVGVLIAYVYFLRCLNKQKCI